MPVWETYSKRQKQIEKAGQPDLLQYDFLPEPFRYQVMHIWRRAIGRFFDPPGHFYLNGSPSSSNRFWYSIYHTTLNEAGLPCIGSSTWPIDRCCGEHLLTADTSGALDIIELSFQVIDRDVRGTPAYGHTLSADITQDPDDAIAELNHRFREHGLGYQYENGIIARVDSQFTHAEIVKPALALLNAAGFEGPLDEFTRAFEHHRHGRNKEAVTEALKAFESTLKSICAVRNWPHSPTATAKELIDVVFSKDLIPPMLQSYFAGFRTAMESGLPTLRNKTSGHGQGLNPVDVPPHFVAYALHLTASNIVFLVQAHNALK